MIMLACCCLRCLIVFLCCSVYSCVFFFFFFSSRRRHTRWPRDWSSDVCSSDLNVRTDMQALFGAFIAANNAPTSGVWIMSSTTALALSMMMNNLGQPEFPGIRSEERRVGKECRCRWARERLRKKGEDWM